MNQQGSVVLQAPALRFALVAAGIIIILAGLQAAVGFIVPILLAVIFAVIFWPPLAALQKRGMSAGMALAAVIIGFFVILILFTVIIAVGIAGFSDRIPAYQEMLVIRMGEMATLVQGWGIEPGNLRSTGEESVFNLGAILGYVVSGVTQIFSYSFIIFFYVIFMLVEATTFGKKLQNAFKDNNRAYTYASEVMSSLQYYLVIKTQISLITGIGVWIGLFLLGLEFALLWGIVAFLLNYIPNFGSIIAAIPAVIVGFVQFGVSWPLVGVIAIYLAANMIVGYVLEPRMMGQGLGLSGLVVLIALLFWGWILGPVGLILSIPITVAIKIFLQGYHGTRWLAVLLSDSEDLPEDAAV
jgi:AI-2 transport protein TqsA